MNNKNNKSLLLLVTASLLSLAVRAEMTSMEDDALSDLTAQAGITIELEYETNQPAVIEKPTYLRAEELRWSPASTDSSAFIATDVGIGQAGEPGAPSTLVNTVQIDVSATEGLKINYDQARRRVAIGNVQLLSNTVAGNPDSDVGVGAFYMDYTLTGDIAIAAVEGGSGIQLKGGSQWNDVDLTYIDKLANGTGRSLHLEGGTIAFDGTAGNGLQFNILDGGAPGASDIIDLTFDKVSQTLSFDSIRVGSYDGTSVSAGGGSLGAFDMNVSLEGAVQILAAEDQTGLVITPQLRSNCFSSDDCSKGGTENNYVNYYDGSLPVKDTDGNLVTPGGVRLGLANYFGQLSTQGGMQLSLLSAGQDSIRKVGSAGNEQYLRNAFYSSASNDAFNTPHTSSGRDFMRLSMPDIQVTLGANNIYIGSSPLSLGEIYAELDFGSSAIDLYPGGVDGTTSGLTLASHWNLTRGDIRYTDDGTSVWVAGLESAGSGSAAFDLVNIGSNIVGTDSIFEKNFVTGIRAELRDVKGYYRSGGLYVTNDEGTPDWASVNLQGGSEALYLLGLYQDISFDDLDAVINFRPGGRSGSGATFAADVVFRDADAGLLVNYNDLVSDQGATVTCTEGCGIWSQGMTWESHYRGGTLDVVSDHVFSFQESDGTYRRENRDAVVVRYFRYGLKTIDSLNLGHKGDLNASTSFGGFAIEENNRVEMAISTGGDPERGSQGLTVALKNNFQKADPNLADYTYVDADGNVRPRKTAVRWYPDKDDPDSESYLEFDDITTDTTVGGDYGLRNTLNIDVVSDSGAGDPGFAINLLTEAREIRMGSINIGSNAILQEAALFNLRVQANVIATPIP